MTETITFWRNRTGRTMSSEDAREAIENIRGFFQILQRWATTDSPDPDAPVLTHTRQGEERLMASQDAGTDGVSVSARDLRKVSLVGPTPLTQGIHGGSPSFSPTKGWDAGSALGTAPSATPGSGEDAGE